MLTFLKFEASWCGPCQALKPTIEQLKDSNPLVVFQNVDIDDNPQLRADYAIRSIPTCVLLDDGKEVARKIGTATLSEFSEMIDEFRGL